MNLALELLQKQARILEASIKALGDAHSAEQKQADMRLAELENVKATLAELRAAIAALSGAKPTAVEEPKRKAK